MGSIEGFVVVYVILTTEVAKEKIPRDAELLCEEVDRHSRAGGNLIPMWFG